MAKDNINGSETAELSRTGQEQNTAGANGSETAELSRTGQEQNTAGARVEIPGELNRKLNETAQKGAQEASQNIVQHIWEPTADNVKKSGLNYVDYVRAAKKAGADINQVDVLNQFYGKDPMQSIKDNEAAEKKAKNKEKMDAIGNAINHLGGFIGSMVGGNGGVSGESPEKFTERQQALKDKTEAMRQKRWQDIYQQLKDQRADDNAKANQAFRERQLEEKMKAAADAAVAKAEENKKKNDRQAAQDKQKQENWQATFDANQKQREISNGLRQQQINKTGKGSGGRSGSGKNPYGTTTVKDTSDPTKTVTSVIPNGPNGKPITRNGASSGSGKTNPYIKMEGGKKRLK